MTIIFFLINLNIVCYGQNFIDSKELSLTKLEPNLFEKSISSNKDFSDIAYLFIIDNDGNKLEELEVYIESYENDSKVEELKQTKFKGVKKIIKVEIAHCACYCNTSKYYWFITKSNQWIELPVVEQEDYELGFKTRDYIFNENLNEIDLVEFQDEMIKKREIDNPTFQLKSKTTLKSYTWNGTKLNEK